MKKNVKAMLGVAMLMTIMAGFTACGKEPIVITPTPAGAATSTPETTPEATKEPETTPDATKEPTAEPTAEPTNEPTATPTPEPTKAIDPSKIPAEKLDAMNPLDFFKDVEWVGDSLMNFYQWRGAQFKDAAHFGSYKANTWFTANSYGVRFAIKDEITTYEPTYGGQQMKLWDVIPKTGKNRIVMFFGTNDIGVTGVDKFIENYQTLIEKIQKTGNYKFYILSMTPMRKDKQSTTGGLSNALIDEANVRLKQLCEEKGYGFVDVASKLKDSEGNLNLAYSDGTNVHIVTEGYKFWDEALIKFAKEQLYIESLAN